MQRAQPGRTRGFEIVAGILGWIVPWFLRAWFWTIRVTVLHPEVQKTWLGPGRHAIGALWHQNFLFYAWYFGHRHVRGSSSRGGAEAIHELVQRVRMGRTAAIVADGPRGPSRVAKNGVL